MKVTLSFEGGTEMAAKLAGLEKKAAKSLQMSALKVAAEPIRESMAALAPHEPGKPDLRDAMQISAAKQSDLKDTKEVGVAVGPSKTRFYGSFQEFGTAHHPAQPFARPAFDKHWKEALQILNDEMWFSIRHGEDRF